MPKEVLIADDDESCRNLLELVIESEGYKVISVENGNQAVHAVTDNPNVSLVFLNRHMPGLGGFKAAERIRSLPEFSSLPLICITADVKTDRDLVRDYHNNLGPFNDLIIKPYEIGTFIDKLHHYLD